MRAQAWNELKRRLPTAEELLVTKYCDEKTTLRDLVKFFNETYLYDSDFKVTRGVVKGRLKALGVATPKYPNKGRDKEQYSRMARVNFMKKVQNIEEKIKEDFPSFLKRLHIECGKPVGEIATLLRDTYGVKVSRGALVALMKENEIPVSTLDRSEVTRKRNLENWENPEYREKMMKLARDPELLEKKSKLAKKQWREDDGTLAKKLMSSNGARNNKLEKSFMASLEKFSIPYSYQNTVLYEDSVIKPDFIVNENVVIEVQGDYWHCNPKTSDRWKNRLDSDKKYERDLFRYTALKSLGFYVIYIWEHDIKKNSEYVEDILKRISSYENLDELEVETFYFKNVKQN